MAERDSEFVELKDHVVQINRVTKVVKGGKNLSFSALVVVGDGVGRVGFANGKAKEVPSAISKGVEKAKKSLIEIPLKGSTIPHAVVGKFGAGRVIMKPAAPGTGVIAGGPVRAVLEVLGVQDVLTKSLGTANPHNVIKATFDGLMQLKDVNRVARMRGIEIERPAEPAAQIPEAETGQPEAAGPEGSSESEQAS